MNSRGRVRGKKRTLRSQFSQPHLASLKNVDKNLPLDFQLVFASLFREKYLFFDNQEFDDSLRGSRQL
jgi:hypothetical protein